MASTYTPSLRLNLQGAGDNLNTWGLILNSGVFGLVDTSISGRLALSLSGSVTLTSLNGVADQARNAMIHVTGGTGGTIIIPSVSKIYQVLNGSAGVVNITAGATSASLVVGESTFIMCDGTNVTKQIPQGFPTPLNGTDAANKAYVDAQAFAATNLPGITAGTAGMTVTNNGVTASWANVYPPLFRTTRTSNTILGVSDRGGYIDITSGSFTQTMTSSVTLGNGWTCIYGNSGTGVITIDPAGTETIGGLLTWTVNPGEIYLLQADGTNINVISIKTDLGPHVIINDQKPSGTGGGAATATTWTDHTLNTTVINLVGASLSTNQLTLSAGTWDLRGWATFQVTNGSRIRIRNVTDATNIAVGSTTRADSGTGATNVSTAEGRVTLAAAKAISLQYWAETAGNLGQSTSSGEPEIYAQLIATRVA